MTDDGIIDPPTPGPARGGRAANARIRQPSATTERRPAIEHSVPRSDGRPISAGDLVEPGAQYWSDRSAEERAEHIGQIEKFFRAITDDLLTQSDICVDRYISLNKSYKRWKIGFILATGLLAIFNVFIASLPSTAVEAGLIQKLSIAAAVYAAIIAVVSNIDNFLQYRERSQAFRQAREEFLDANRQYTMLWLSYVRPFGDSPTACINASRLYRRAVIRDQELRALVKQLTDTDRDVK